MREIEYEDGKGFKAGNCPACGIGEGVSFGSNYFASDVYQVSLVCDNCGAEWVENYGLMSAVVTKEGFKAPDAECCDRRQAEMVG